MRAGKLANKIVIQSASESQNSQGEATYSWSTYATRQASYEPINGREFFASDHIQAHISTRFKLRYDSLTKAITPKMRVSYGGVYYNIESVIPMGKSGTKFREIHLMCTERL